MDNLPWGVSNKDIERACWNCEEDGHDLDKKGVCRICRDEFEE